MGKALAMICVFSCCTLAGLMVSSRLKQRTDCLESLIGSVRHLRAKLDFTVLPLFELVKKIGDSRSQVLWTSFSLKLEHGSNVKEAWAEALDEASSQESMFASLKDKELNALSDFFSSLGKHDLATQRKGIDVIEIELRECLEAAKTELTKKGKLYSSFGILAGLCGVIIIW